MVLVVDVYGAGGSGNAVGAGIAGTGGCAGSVGGCRPWQDFLVHRRYYLRFFLNFRLCLFAGLLPNGLLRLTVTLLLYWAIVSVSSLFIVLS